MKIQCTPSLCHPPAHSAVTVSRLPQSGHCYLVRKLPTANSRRQASRSAKASRETRPTREPLERKRGHYYRELGSRTIQDDHNQKRSASSVRGDPRHSNIV